MVRLSSVELDDEGRRILVNAISLERLNRERSARVVSEIDKAKWWPWRVLAADEPAAKVPREEPEHQTHLALGGIAREVADEQGLLWGHV